MKQLHTSYSNLGSWMKKYDPVRKVSVFKYNQRPGYIVSSVVFILCSLAAFGLTQIKGKSHNERLTEFAPWFLLATGVGTAGLILTYGYLETQKGDLLRYHHETEALELPRAGLNLEDARSRVWFSSEHFTDGNHYFELNIVIDVERTKFLSSSVANGFKSIATPLEKLGFAVHHQKIKL